MKCPNCRLENPPGALRCDCGYDFPSGTQKGSYLPPAESGPIGVVSSGWLWAARCSALICTIDLGVGFAVEAAAHGSGLALFFGYWGSLSLALLYLLFRRGKNSLAFALGLGAGPALIALLGVALVVFSRISEVLGPLGRFLVQFSGGQLAFVVMRYSPQLATLGALLLGLFSISLAMLGLSSIVAYQKIAHEAKGMGKLRFAFGAGICCAPVFMAISVLLYLFLFAPHAF